MANFIDEGNGSTKRQTIKPLTYNRSLTKMISNVCIENTSSWTESILRLTMLISPTDINLFTMRSSTQRPTSCY